MDLDTILAAILGDDRESAEELLKAEPALATRLVKDAKLYESKIFHWIYVGDTALHLAAAGYRVEIARLLLTAWADPNSAINHRRSGPLHYAADGYIDGPEWDAKRQVDTIRCLLGAGPPRCPGQEWRYPFAPGSAYTMCRCGKLPSARRQRSDN